jgi:hypothetical protein
VRHLLEEPIPVPNALVIRDVGGADAELDDIARLVSAILKLKILIPERVAVKVETNEVSCSFEEPVLLALLYPEENGAWEEREGEGSLQRACDVGMNQTVDLETLQRHARKPMPCNRYGRSYGGELRWGDRMAQVRRAMAQIPALSELKVHCQPATGLPLAMGCFES